ncbi:MAG: sugar phosphate nucleotidyltransferase [Candidatus Sumerlaeia bacterium]|nr:sugar phosphate nucleotidyltransferase [Candidatus Sumerlaeia bacterium]
MRAVVLAGGKGTRLRPYTTVLPKPLMPIGDRPILAIVLERLAEAGFRKVTLSVGHLAEIIMAFCGGGARWGLEIDYAHEDEPLGTIGPLRIIRDLGPRFLVMNGDVLTDLDLGDLVAFHAASGAEATVATHHRVLGIDFGVLGLDASGTRIAAFTEKPRIEHDVSMGVYVLDGTVLRFVPEGRAFGFDGLMAAMLAEGAPVAAFRHRGAWLDIGRPDDYERAQELFGQAP